jgi:hypothetical protein
MMTKGLIGFGASLVLIAFVADTDAQDRGDWSRWEIAHPT